ncbi:MAG: hypothetical protein LUH82_03860 [Clostridiales bacterium]|nr:hypothetical protein [Clostridiales bacterium]
MVQKILNFIISMLIGAIIATAGFLIYFSINKTDDAGSGKTQSSQQESGAEQNAGNDNSTVPEKPDGEAGGETPPEMPRDTGGENTAGGE